uniref:Merozoite surface antigen 2 n=6 Tax=Plasmodium falciparum TaxID=5833 RepID=B7SX46_PLAFA|nr:merozoite surface protein 2 [Plasmodium falciparum]ACJ01927.1 merozoite surface protein 2 [Plasmodium falciparum]ACJ01956.1 merozoite surface protein 2 [Plasmodium falciparum]ACJ01965.1 merozoite surface protein 2 [Plasmodium falciparum]ACJ01980.1 merozoite surface protein 2 [Plasmodium falciparum]
MKVIKTLSIINFFIFVTFNIKNESKYSNTFINNAYNMSIRRSMANEGSNTTSVGANAPNADTIASGSQSSTNSASTSTTNNGESQTTTPTAADTPTATKSNSPSPPITTTESNSPSPPITTTESNSPSPPITTTESSSSGNAPNKTDGKGEESKKKNELNESTEEGPKAPQEPQTAENENPAAPENKGTGQHGHMHGSRNNHPQNTSDSQKECTDGNKENCGAATSLLNNSSNIASINKFVVLISATLVLSFAIFI